MALVAMALAEASLILLGAAQSILSAQLCRNTDKKPPAFEVTFYMPDLHKH